jgi:hypothetical protein
MDCVYDDVTTFWDNLEENTPIPHAAAETGKTLKLANVSFERVSQHLAERCQDSGLIARRDALKRLLRGCGEDDGPFH